MNALEFSRKSTATLWVAFQGSGDDDSETRMLNNELAARFERYSRARASCVPHWARMQADNIGAASCPLWIVAFALFLMCLSISLLKWITDDSLVDETADLWLWLLGILCAIAAALGILFTAVFVVAYISQLHTWRELKAQTEINV